MKCKKSTLKMTITKRKCKNLTDVRTVFFLLSNEKYKSLPNSRRVLKSVFSSTLSWQKRKAWVDLILAWEGKRGESFEWQCILHNSAEKALKLRTEKIERITGKNNPGYNHGGKFSVFSDKFVGKSSKEDSLQKMKITKAKNKHNENTSIEYYLNKGLDYERAKAALTERQTTNSLKRYIKIYGQKEGEKRYAERNAKWQNTLKNKPPEERARINSLKCSKGYSVSKAETELFETLHKVFGNIQKALAIAYDDSKKYYVYDIALNDKIIEYNGDFWHANPNVYDETFYNKVSKMSSKEIWKKELHKEKVAINNGYKILKVWESDYKQNKEKVVAECISFLTQ